jgi:hypothetical protein
MAARISPLNRKVRAEILKGRSSGEIANRLDVDSGKVSRIRWSMKQRGLLNGTPGHLGESSRESAVNGEEPAAKSKTPTRASTPKADRQVVERPTCTLSADVPEGGTVQIYIRVGAKSIGSLFVNGEGIAFAQKRLTGKRRAKVVPFARLEKVLAVLD